MNEISLEALQLHLDPEAAATDGYKFLIATKGDSQRVFVSEQPVDFTRDARHKDWEAKLRKQGKILPDEKVTGGYLTKTFSGKLVYWGESNRAEVEPATEAELFVALGQNKISLEPLDEAKG